MSNSDPLASLIDYVGTVKPYHTKVYEIILNYVYDQPVKTTVKEKYQISVLMTTPEANKWYVIPGVGWDTAAFDTDPNQPWVDLDGRGPQPWGHWDYPQTSTSTSPSKIITDVSEDFQLYIDMVRVEDVQTYADVHSLGWDMTPWDSDNFDGPMQPPRMFVEQQDDDGDAAGATITETIDFQIS